ncbi:MAG: deaminase [Octadecabacter sp.]
MSKTAHSSDFFVRNDRENKERLLEVLGRFLEIVFGVTVHTPTLDESGMYAAVSAANKSACLSRQVGAAIYSKSGELLSVGWNDVPKAGGGLYSDDDGKNDHRCFKWRDCSCHNDRKKELLYKEIYEALLVDIPSKDGPKSLLTKDATRSMVEAAIKTTAVKSLIEYSRSIHAEMEAIVSAARLGKLGLVGAKLYTTTFPCHNCARHIVAAGIKEVYYIEPYSKSLAIELHGDAISLTKKKKMVSFLQYEGVGPNVSMKLFQAHDERKEHGKARIYDKKSADPVLPPPLDGFTTHEKRVIERIQMIEAD